MFHPSFRPLPALFILPLSYLMLGEGVPATPPGGGIGPAVVDEQLDGLLAPRERGYLGADGAATVELSPGRVLWIFGDTFLGTLVDGTRKGSMVRNSIAIQDFRDGLPGSVEYYWDLEDDITDDFFRALPGEEAFWYWPGCGIDHDGKVYLFLTKLQSGEGAEGFAFETIDCTLFRIQYPEAGPREWSIDRVDLGFGNQNFNINVAAIVEEDHVFLIGYDDGPDATPMERSAILSRIPVAALDGEAPGESVEFLQEDGSWARSREALARLFQPGTTESGLVYNERIGRYVTFTISPFQPEILAVTAADLAGPWSEPEPVYTIGRVEEDDNLHAYAPRLHPMLAPDGRSLVLTYVVNTKDFWSVFEDTDVYYPRFLRIHLDQ